MPYINISFEKIIAFFLTLQMFSTADNLEVTTKILLYR